MAASMKIESTSGHSRFPFEVCNALPVVSATMGVVIVLGVMWIVVLYGMVPVCIAVVG